MSQCKRFDPTDDLNKVEEGIIPTPLMRIESGLLVHGVSERFYQLTSPPFSSEIEKMVYYSVKEVVSETLTSYRLIFTYTHTSE
jgi:hypothetical protein